MLVLAVGMAGYAGLYLSTLITDMRAESAASEFLKMMAKDGEVKIRFDGGGDD